MPPAALRRPLTVTTWLILCTLVLLTSPIILLAGAIGAAMLGRPQPRLIAHALVAYCAREIVVLIASGALWIMTGFGRRMSSRRAQLLHLRLLHWFVHSAAGRVLTLLDVRVEQRPSPEAAAALAADRPVLFCSRHAGPGDTLLLVDLLMDGYDRHPSIVLKQMLVLDPCVDLLAHRLPHAILDPSDPEACETRIAEVCAQLDSRGALVLFPEGGNFTPERRHRALRHLRRHRREREAAAAERMTHVMPPHPRGVLAAMRGNPAADVIFAAHTGLGLKTFARELWREVPMHRTLTIRMWLAPAADRPEAPEAQVEWLYAWWHTLDAWVAEQDKEREEASRPSRRCG